MTSTRAAATLDGFAKATDAVQGVYLRDLEPLTRLVVRTCNSEYQFIVSARRGRAGRGRAVLRSATPAVLEGASLGGSFLKVGWIGVGLRMEIRDASRRIVTSPVRHIAAPGDVTAVVH